ncbi:MAG: hypothetical protein KF862_03460 [Chitinophagaceae bacterium]|nr:hypothetical protein [Chitinophagaceae bacterium]
MKFLLGILLVGLSITSCNNAGDSTTDSNSEISSPPATQDTSNLSPADTTLNKDTGNDTNQ